VASTNAKRLERLVELVEQRQRANTSPLYFALEPGETEDGGMSATEATAFLRSTRAVFHGWE
jgi:hypothetical protein